MILLRKALSVCSLAAGCLLVSVSAPAQDEIAAAEALFNEGRELMEGGQTEAACAKFAESQRLDPSAGTALNLARCYEKLGRTASAWAQYKVARRIALSQGRQRIVDEATGKADELEPGLARLSLDIAKPVEGLTVSLGETQLEPAVLGSKIPVDPGPLHVKVTAEGYQSYETDVEIPAQARDTTVMIPGLVPLEDEPAAADPEPGAADPGAEAATPRVEPEADHTLAYVFGGVGIAALGTSVGLGFAAKSKNDEARDQCGGATSNCPASAIATREDAQSLADIGTAVGVVGLASLAVGVVLYVIAEPEDESLGARVDGWDVGASLNQDSASVLLKGTF